MPGVILGTAAYMAPEQAKGRPVDKRADIWAFGCVLYEMVTGRRAFGGEDVSETIASILKTDPDWTGVPPSIKPTLVSCLQKDPRKRLRDIGDVALTLEPSAPPAERARSSSSLVAWSLALVAAAAAIALAVLHFGERPPALPEPTMFALAAPENTELADSYLSLSRDGRRLAFTARDRDGRLRIWIRDFATTTVRAVPGSEGARSPFWSPDGGTLAFAVDRRLYKAGLDGGKPQVLCEIEHNAGVGSWNDAGTIVFGSRLGGPIYRVSAAGGRAEPITALDRSRAESFHAIPVFLRDGRRFLYFRNSLNRSDSGIYVGSLDQPPDRQPMKALVTSDHGPGYFAPTTGAARVLYVSDRTNLMSQELDETRLELLGEPQLEVPQIASAGSIAFFSVAGSGTLVYRHGVAGAPSANQLTWFDRQGQVLGPAADPGGYGPFTLSPDGRRVAATMAAAERAPDLWMIDVERKINTRFTTDGATNQFPIWSADGSTIVFRSNRAGRFDLYEKNATGLEPERLLLQTPFDKIPASASVDGRFILFDSTDAKGGTDIWLLTRGATPPAHPLIASAFNELQAVFSPDGRLIAYVSDESGRPEVHVRTFTPPGQPAAAGAGQWRISNGGGTRPRWRADGKELLYRNDALIMSVAIDSAGSRFTPGAPMLLFDSQSIFSNAWDVTADGQRFLLAVAPGTRSSEPITVVLNWRPGARQAQ